MCDRINILARIDHHRWIGCCEHGAVHLAWDSVAVRLPLQRLGEVAQALHECAQIALHFRIASSVEVCVVFDQHDIYQVWIGGAGLCLAPEDFRLLCQLLSRASEHPQTVMAAGAKGDKQSATLPDSPIRTTYNLFSLN